MVGHIKLDRKILEWEWYKDANVSRVFIHLLLTANHKDGRWKGIELKRGQVVTGRLELSKGVRLSEMQIRYCLNKLKTTNEITIKVTNKFSIITICKYDVYQSFKNENNQQGNQQITQPVTNNYPTSNQQVTTNNNDNNDKEGNKAKEEGVFSIFENPKLWDSEKQTFFNAGDWIFKFCTDKKISVDLFDEQAKEFISDIELKGDFKSVKEIRSHFTSWFNKKRENGFHKQKSELSPYHQRKEEERKRAMLKHQQ